MTLQTNHEPRLASRGLAPPCEWLRSNRRSPGPLERSSQSVYSANKSCVFRIIIVVSTIYSIESAAQVRNIATSRSYRHLIFAPLQGTEVRSASPRLRQVAQLVP